MSMSTLVVIGILFVAWVFIKQVLPRLIVRQVGRFALKKVGEAAMAKVPEQIQYVRATAPQWKDEAAMQRQSGLLVQAGFNDLGVYNVDKMPGAVIRVL